MAMDLVKIQKDVTVLKKATNKKKGKRNVKTDGLTHHQLTDYNNISDSFVRYRTMIEDAIDVYNQAKQMAAVSDAGLSASVNRMAEPFRKGYFTLAVVGKMSAGKTTFINALLGDSNLLPTGHFQTTCTLTTIQHSDEKRLRVIYGDGHEGTIETNIELALNHLVAISEEYKDLPVNNINRLILADKTMDEICSKELIQKMEDLSKIKISVDLLKKYIKTHPKSDIPMAVVIEWPLKEMYRGWRIVDTPGVDAIGGIEDDTNLFLCGSDENGNHNVDAIVFVQKAQGNIQERTLNEFISQTINSLTAEAKKRTFFVLTHASKPEFLTLKDSIMDTARRLFVDYEEIGIDAKRLIAVDSKASLMGEDVLLDFKTLIKKSAAAPSHWKEEEWMGCRELIKQVKGILEEDEEVEFNNENTRRKLLELAQFDILRQLLDQFVQTEKGNLFKEIINSIDEDIARCVTIKEKDIKILELNLGSTPEKFLSNLQQEKEKLDDFQQTANMQFQSIRNQYSKSNVDTMFQEQVINGLSPETFRSLSSVDKMHRKAEELCAKARLIEEGICEEIKNEVKSLIGKSELSMNISLPAIDIDEIHHKAKEESTTSYKETYRVRKKEGILSGIGRLFGKWLQTDWGWETATRTITTHDADKEQQIVAEKVFEILLKNLDGFKTNVQKELRTILEHIDAEIKNIIQKRKDDFDQLSKGEDLVKTIDQRQEEINILNEAQKILNIYHSPVTLKA